MRVAGAAKQFAVEVGGSAIDAEPARRTWPAVLPLQSAVGRIHGVGGVVSGEVEHTLHHQKAALEGGGFTSVIGAGGAQGFHVAGVISFRGEKPRCAEVAVVGRPFDGLREPRLQREVPEKQQSNTVLFDACVSQDLILRQCRA